MIDLTIPPGMQRREWVVDAMTSVFDQVVDTVDLGRTPPQIEEAADRVARACAHDDPVETDDALGVLAHAAIAAKVRVRCEYPDLGASS